MVIVLILLTVVVFVLVDLALRVTLRKMEEAKAHRERQRALDEGLKLEFADEAKSLKRVAVERPRARILAVDDEPVVLDSFRKILVLAGFSVDTVETGQEALSLVRQHEYDFVFTDLKMPGLDGLDVTKAVKHLRPDVDVAIITGYGTIETAVSGMKYGAVDYVEKPFTEDELVDFANRLLIRRQERLARQQAPEVRLVTPSSVGASSPRVVNVPGGVYVSPEHTWVTVEMNGEGRIGLDDFFHKTLGPVDTIRFPEKGKVVRRGEPLFTIGRGDWSLTFSSPLSGRVSRVNHELDYHPSLARLRPYEQGWVCALEPEALTQDLERMRIGADAVAWYRQEIETFRKAMDLELGAPVAHGDAETPDDDGGLEAARRAFDACFLGSRNAAGSALRAPERETASTGSGR